MDDAPESVTDAGGTDALGDASDDVWKYDGPAHMFVPLYASSSVAGKFALLVERIWTFVARWCCRSYLTKMVSLRILLECFIIVSLVLIGTGQSSQVFCVFDFEASEYESITYLTVIFVMMLFFNPTMMFLDIWRFFVMYKINLRAHLAKLQKEEQEAREFLSRQLDKDAVGDDCGAIERPGQEDMNAFVPEVSVREDGMPVPAKSTTWNAVNRRSTERKDDRVNMEPETVMLYRSRRDEPVEDDIDKLPRGDDDDDVTILGLGLDSTTARDRVAHLRLRIRIFHPRPRGGPGGGIRRHG